ncbi:hypothetical protein H6G36_02325 [Anabaena minutissima FACHB-250]|nr:hypothetical protein [Anabaena minutissima FACHB-250]
MQTTLEQLFGVNAAQDSQALVIQKSDLPSLTPNINNSAESLLIAIILQALENFQGEITTPEGEKIVDPNNNPITYNNSVLYATLLVERFDGFIEQRSGSYVVRNTLIIHQFTEYADTEFS